MFFDLDKDLFIVCYQKHFHFMEFHAYTHVLICTSAGVVVVEEIIDNKYLFIFLFLLNIQAAIRFLINRLASFKVLTFSFILSLSSLFFLLFFSNKRCIFEGE